MGDKVPKLEEGELIDKPPAPARSVFSPTASTLSVQTPRVPLAELLRRINTARTTYKLGAVELRNGSTSTSPLTFSPSHPFATPAGTSSGPVTRPAALSDTMFGYQGPSRVAQGFDGGNAGFGNGNPGPPPSERPRSIFGIGPIARVAESPAPGPVPVIRGGGRDSCNAGPVQQLSSECQRRRFNPEFKIIMQDGRYKCNVLVQNVFIQGSRLYDNPQEAKVTTSLKALKTVQSWPVPSSANPTASIRGRQESQRASESETEKEWPRPSGPSSTSGVDMSDPLQARAFVEGFRMGQLAAAPNRPSTEDRTEVQENKRMSDSRRSRSRSPRRRRRGSRHRSRSARPYFDGSRHDPSLPSTDKYRPAASGPLPRDDEKSAKEDSYGRLKQDEYH